MNNDARIFPYHDGRGDVFADPLATLGRLVELLDGDPNHTLLERRQKDNDVVSELARRRITVAARAAFEMTPYDKHTGEGALDADCEKVFDDFLGWLDGVKKNGVTTPHSPPSMAPRELLDPPRSPPKPASDSSSTPSDCGCD
jgi:hypothetical protein